MSSIKILDTGYISNETIGTQTQLSDANRAGYTGSAVSAITLGAVSTGVNGDVNIEQKPIIGSLINNSSSLVSVNNRTIPISFVLAKSIVTSGWSVNNVHQILRLDRTKGLKLLYPSATGDSIPTVVEAMGQVNLAGNFSEASPTDDKGTVATTTPYLLGRVKGLSVTDSPDSKYWRISFNFVLYE